MNGYGGPAEYAMQQEREQKQNLQNIINMFLQHKQYQREQELRERDRQYKMSQDVKQSEFEERRTKAYEENVRPRGATPRAITEWEYEDAQARDYFKDNPAEYQKWRLRIKDEKPPVEPKEKKEPAIPQWKTPEYRYRKLIDDTESRYKSERDKLIGAVGKIDPTSPNRKALESMAGNLDTFLGRLAKIKSDLEIGGEIRPGQVEELQLISQSLQKVMSPSGLAGLEIPPAAGVTPREPSQEPSQVAGKDQYGYSLGEVKKAKDGSDWEYIGENKWRKVGK